MTNPIAAWRCDECDTVHEDEDAARECCQPRTSSGYTCEDCGTFHLMKETAIACCQDEPEEPHTPTGEELEAAGQLRLLP